MEFTNQSLSIRFENFDLSKENLLSKTSIQLVSQIAFYNGHEQLDSHSEKTPWIYFGFSPFPSGEGKYPLEREKRNFLKIKYDDADKYYLETKDLFNKYTDAFNKQKKEIFNNDKNRIEFTDISYAVNAFENESTGITTESSRLSIEPLYQYYYNNELLDEENINLINKTIYADKIKRKGSEFTTHKESLTYKIKYPQKSQETINVTFNTGLENRKDFKFLIHYREIDNYDKNTMKNPNECSEEELNEIFGEAKTIKIYTPEEMDEYCKGYSYYQFGFIIDKLWSTKNKDAKSKRYSAGIKFICPALSIIKIKGNVGGSSKKPSKTDSCAQYLLGIKKNPDIIKDESSIKKSDKTQISKSSSDSDEIEHTKKESKKPVSKEESSSDSDVPEPPKKDSKKPISKMKSSSDSDEPPKKESKKPVAKAKSSSDSDSDSDEPEPPKKQTKKPITKAESSSDSDEPEPPKKQTKKPIVKAESSSDSDDPEPPKKAVGKKR